MSGRQVFLGVVGEAEFERWVVRTAHRHGWCGHHNRSSQGSVAGVHHLNQDGHDDAYGKLDWEFWHPGLGAYMQRELKTQTGRLRRDQQRTLEDLQKCGVDAKVWRPADEAEIVETFGRAA